MTNVVTRPKTLPVSHQDFWAETGRVTKGTALALKSRALLYAASLLHNPAQDADKWKAAADAAYAIIKRELVQFAEDECRSSV